MNQTIPQASNLDDPVGNYLRPEAAKLFSNWTVGQALDRIREQKYDGGIVYFYVVDNNEKLAGVIPVRRLLTSPVETVISEIMVKNVISVPTTASLLDAAELMLKHRFMALPVVDNGGILAGMIDLTLFTDEFSLRLHGEKDDRAFQLIGVHVAYARAKSSFKRYRDRFPWLLCNIAGGLICAFIASAHEDLISLITMLAIFIPVVLTLAESVSMQSMTLSIQAVPHGKNRWPLLWRSVRWELMTSLLLGTSCGLIVGGISLIWKGNLAASISVTASIALAVMAACMLGVIVPGLVRGFKIDPKIASGPIVLATADILTLLFYFGIASYLQS